MLQLQKTCNSEIASVGHPVKIGCRVIIWAKFGHLKGYYLGPSFAFLLNTVCRQAL